MQQSQNTKYYKPLGYGLLGYDRGKETMLFKMSLAEQVDFKATSYRQDSVCWDSPEVVSFLWSLP